MDSAQLVAAMETAWRHELVRQKQNVDGDIVEALSQAVPVSRVAATLRCRPGRVTALRNAMRAQQAFITLPAP